MLHGACHAAQHPAPNTATAVCASAVAAPATAEHQELTACGRIALLMPASMPSAANLQQQR